MSPTLCAAATAAGAGGAAGAAGSVSIAVAAPPSLPPDPASAPALCDAPVSKWPTPFEPACVCMGAAAPSFSACAVPGAVVLWVVGREGGRGGGGEGAWKRRGGKEGGRVVRKRGDVTRDARKFFPRRSRQ